MRSRIYLWCCAAWRARRARKDLQVFASCRQLRRPQQVDLWVRVVHVCVGTAACLGTADSRPCAPQAKNYRFVPFFLKKTFFIW